MKGFLPLVCSSLILQSAHVLAEEGGTGTAKPVRLQPGESAPGPSSSVRGSAQRFPLFGQKQLDSIKADESADRAEPPQTAPKAGVEVQKSGRPGSGEASSPAPVAATDPQAVVERPSNATKAPRGLRGVLQLVRSAPEARTDKKRTSSGAAPVDYYVVRAGEATFHQTYFSIKWNTEPVPLPPGAVGRSHGEGEKWAWVELADGTVGLMRKKELGVAEGHQIAGFLKAEEKNLLAHLREGDGDIQIGQTEMRVSPIAVIESAPMPELTITGSKTATQAPIVPLPRVANEPAE